MSRQRVARSQQGRGARERAAVARGLPPLPNTTPHSLRRTHVRIALLANNFDVLFVMSEVGHSGSKITADVYAELQQRARREHGEAFDKLVRTARERLCGADPEDEKATEARSIRPRIETRKRKMGVEDRAFSYGETRTRTGDTTIFRQMLRTLEQSRKYLQIGWFSSAPRASRCRAISARM
jgi:hypothetical protein